MAAPIKIDGSFGEGGGQILRSSLCLSLLTGRPFHIENIRSGRKKPGLLKQHLAAVQAAAAVGAATVNGAAPGSGALSFEPAGIFPGNYHFDVGSAGSCILVLQTVLPALMTAGAPSLLHLGGGTHNPFAPPFDFLEKTFLPLIHRMGPRISTELLQWGFFPAGMGRLKIAVQPAANLQPIEILDRGQGLGIQADAWVANLPLHIAQREARTLTRTLDRPDLSIKTGQVREAAGPGNIISIACRFEQLTEVFTGFGRRGVRAEEVAAQAAGQVKQYLATHAPVGRYLADQLLIPMAMAGAGCFHTVTPSSHTRTNLAVVERFMETKFSVQEDRSGQHRIQVLD